MADYWISYRVHHNGDSAYARRYDALITAIDDCATGGQWNADTSFLAIRSKYSIDSIGQHLKKALTHPQDHLVIREIGINRTRYLNSPGDGFSGFFPEAKKL